SESGQITAWNPSLNPITQAVTVANTPDAIYKGLAIANTLTGPRLYASDFHNGTIRVFDQNFQPVLLSPAAFQERTIHHGLVPFNMQEIGGKLFVTYAKQDADAEDDVPGPGRGFVDVFDTDGNLLQRFARRGPLNAPWGLTVAPANFGPFAGSLLVGNFG